MRDGKKISGKAFQQTASLLTATLESTADGLLVIDNRGKVTVYNNKFLSMWHIPESLAAKKDDKILLENVLSQLKDPDGFIEKVKQLYSQPEANSFDVLEFKDGRVFERYSQPQKLGNETVGRVWSFRDVTDRRRAEEEQRLNRETAEHVAGEMATLAEIGRVIGSTMDIDEVYDRFAVEIKKLIPFDRLAVNLHSLHEGTVKVAYVFGEAISGRSKGELFPLKGSVSEVIAKTRAGLYSYRAEGHEMDQRFDNYAATVQEGLRSLMGVPLIYRDEVIGSLHFRSKSPNAYTDRDLRLAEKIGVQIAGAIGTAQLFSDLKQAENSLRESEELFRTLSDKAPLGMCLIDIDGRYEYVNPAFVKIFGYDLSDIPTGKEWFGTAYPDPEYRRKVMADWKEDLSSNGNLEIRPRIYEVRCKGGDFRTIIFRPVTLPSGKQFIVYEDITDRKRAEQEIGTVAEIGRLVSSTLDIDEVYERFAVEARKRVFFDRITINLNNHDQNTVTVAYAFGSNVPGRRVGDSFPLQGSVNEVLARTKTGMLLHPTSADELTGQYPHLVSTFQQGISSFMTVPLIYRDELIGVLHFRAKKPNAYSEQDLRLAERIGGQIAGAIANAQLYNGLKKTEKSLRESEKRYRELSIVDDLTQLYNSRHFYFQLKIELDRANRYQQPLTLMLLDLDNFKYFNDIYGHVEGDQVLRRLGRVVKQCLRETDFAYRYGGEEFTILLPMTTSADGAVTAERIRTEFKKETFSPAPGQDVHVTVSVGLAQYKPQEEMKAFVHRVDQLMYQGKKNGKDRVCCESSPQEEFKWQSSIQFDIERC